MSEKKITGDEIRAAIEAKFGTVAAYAKAKGTVKENLYGKISRRSDKFIRELVRDGILSGVDFSGASNVNIKGEYGGIGLTSGNTKVYNSGNERVKELEAENKHLKEKVKLLEEMILILKEK